MHAGYYEAIIQVRPASGDAEKFIESGMEERGKGKIVRKKRLKAGVDFYITSWKLAVAIGNSLVRRFGGRMQVTRKIYGRSRKKGAVVYRCTVAFRLPELVKGEVIAFGSDVFQITSSGREFTGKNLATGKKRTIRGGEWKKLERRKAQVSSSFPRLEVISPEDYQSIPVANPREVGSERVWVVVHNGRAYLVD